LPEIPLGQSAGYDEIAILLFVAGTLEAGMNVVIVSNVFPNSQEPQRGLFTFQMVKELGKLCGVTVVAPLPWVPRGLADFGNGRFAHARVPDREEVDGIIVYHPRYVAIPKVGFSHPFGMLRPLIKCLRLLDEQRPIDVINAHWMFPDGIAAVKAGRRLGKTVVLTAMGCDINKYATMPLRRTQIVQAMLGADRVTAKSRSLKEAILGLQIPENKVSLIRNGINLDMFQIVDRDEARKRLGLPDGKRIILTVGRHDEEKGLCYLIDAFSKLASGNSSQYLLVLVGDGPIRSQLEEQARQLGVSESVLFAGLRPHREVSLWMNAADLFCISSLREGHPNAAIEALACGIPIVASRVGEIPWMVSDESGLIAPVGDANGLYAALAEALGRKWSRTAIRASVEGYDWKQCAMLYYRTYRDALQKATTHSLDARPSDPYVGQKTK
jgi:teichuronic acid biosynthesis glycosyltransferase TuaC